MPTTCCTESELNIHEHKACTCFFMHCLGFLITKRHLSERFGLVNHIKKDETGNKGSVRYIRSTLSARLAAACAQLTHKI